MPDFLYVLGKLGNVKIRPKYLDERKDDRALKMRISPADSQMNGFKKWSDAQRVKSELGAVDAPQKPAAVGPSAVGKEESNDGPW